nr:S4 domain-containing protein YaaA [uncultured Leptotrichia sp.]
MNRKIAENIEIVEIKTYFIKLDQLLKWTNLTGSGSEAKMFILNGDVKVNGEVELRRGKKIHEGDIVEFNGEKITVKVQK